MTLRTCASVILSASLLTACSSEEGPTGITDPMGAVGKFCHQLRRTAGAIDLTLEFGDPAIAKITARTDTCEPPAGQPCVAIPTGRVPLRLLEGTKLLGTRTVILEKGKEYGFEPVVIATGQIELEGGALGTGACSRFSFPDAAAPDGSTTEGGTTDAIASDAVRTEVAADGLVEFADVARAVDAAPDAGVTADAAPIDAAAPAVDAAADVPEADAGVDTAAADTATVD